MVAAATPSPHKVPSLCHPPPVPQHGTCPGLGPGLELRSPASVFGGPTGRGEQLGTCNVGAAPGDPAHPSLHTGVPLAQQ